MTTRHDDHGDGTKPGLLAEDAAGLDELARLRREVSQLRAERDAAIDHLQQAVEALRSRQGRARPGPRRPRRLRAANEKPALAGAAPPVAPSRLAGRDLA